MRDYDVAIVGGGPAGSVAASLLARGGHSVVLLEKQHFPRHKLCGEFLSPEALDVLSALPGVVEAIKNEGRPVTSLILTAGRERANATLPSPGTAITRYVLDALLFETAGAGGVELSPGIAAQEIIGTLDDGFQVNVFGESIRARIVIGTFGRTSSVERQLNRRDAGLPSPYVALKQYYNTSIESDAVEIHAVGGGYCGVVNIAPQVANVCCLIRKEMLKEAGGAEALLAYLKPQSPALGRRLDEPADILERPLAVSNLHFRPRATFHRDVCLAGDAAGMIAPLCGDGMAMAVSSADLAARHASSFLRGEIDAGQFKSGYASDWNRQFRSSMWTARQVQRMFVGRKAAASLGVRSASFAPWIVGKLFKATRGTARGLTPG